MIGTVGECKPHKSVVVWMLDVMHADPAWPPAASNRTCRACLDSNTAMSMYRGSDGLFGGDQMLPLLEEPSLGIQGAASSRDASPPAPKHAGETPCVTLRPLEARGAEPREYSHLCIPALEQGRLSRL